MADRREVLELGPEDELDTEPAEGEEDEDQDEPGEPADEAEHDDEGDEPTETLIGFEGEEAAPASESDNSVIRELRRANRELAKRVAEQERGKAPEKVEVGSKPELEDFDYDQDRYDAALFDWRDRKAKAERADQERQDREKTERDAWQQRISAFEQAKTRLNVSDFDEAEAEVQAVLPPEIQAIVLHAEKSAELVYALGRNPAKLAELSKLDPLRAAMAVGKLEDKLTVTKRALPNPDRAVRGNAAPASADKQLAKLEKKAAQTGDRTEVIAYKRKLKSRAH